MLNKIKELADEAVKLQNKNRMDEVLREISVMCTPVPDTEIEEDAPVAKKQRKGKADE